MNINKLIKSFLLRIVKLLISRFYKNKYLKIIYGVFSENPEIDDFARRNGVIELLYRKSMIKTDNPICNEFIETRFNRTALVYEENVKKSGYTSRELLQFSRIVNQISLKFNRKIKVLDLGCGIGLLAKMISLKNLELTGVDISKEMLNECRKKNLYHHLSNNDLISFFERNSSKYDLILACSVIPFIPPSEIENLMKTISKRLNKGGVFIFSFDVSKERYKINHNLFGEYSVSFIGEILDKYFENYNFKFIANSRIESGKKVNGAIANCS